MEWDIEQEQLALEKVTENSSSKVSPDERGKNWWRLKVYVILKVS